MTAVATHPAEVRTATAEDLIPVVRPAYGAETARVVLNIVREFPQHHLQNFFQIEEIQRFGRYRRHTTPDKCGTTRCIAGWAQYVHEGIVNSDVEAKAALFLGLDGEDSEALFFTMEEDKAVAALCYVADGRRIDWEELEFRDDWRMKETANG